MRIKKREIQKSYIKENTSNTTVGETNKGTQEKTNNTPNIKKSTEEINQFTEKIKATKKEIEATNSEIEATNSEIENGPIGAFMTVTENDSNGIEESIKSKRRIIKIIKVKDLK